MKKILLAEDDKNLSRSVDILLTLDGHQVVTVYNGEEALYKICHQKYDLLITDLIMPEVSGVDLIKKIKSLKMGLKIMVVSGKLNDELIAELDRQGVRYILPKPINPPRFRKMVEKALGSSNHS